jgi:hypothetical protein
MPARPAIEERRGRSEQASRDEVTRGWNRTQLDVEGRSRMNKSELVKALRTT